MRRIAIINQKGGVGKTTTSANLGAALAEQGRRVVVVDMDPQANASMHLGIEAVSHEPSVYKVLTGELGFAACMRETKSPRLWVVPSNIDLSGAELELASAIGRDSLIRDAIEDWSAKHRAEHGVDPADYVIFDCPPSLGLLSINALAAAGEVLITLQTQFLALMGMSKLVEVVQLIRRRLNPELTITGIVPCLYDSRLKLNREVLGEVRKYFPGQVFKNAIRSNVKLAEAPSFGVSILDYASESNGAQDYRLLALEVMEQEPRDSTLAHLPAARSIDELARERAAQQAAVREQEFQARDARNATARAEAEADSEAEPEADDAEDAVESEIEAQAAAEPTVERAAAAAPAPVAQEAEREDAHDVAQESAQEASDDRELATPPLREHVLQPSAPRATARTESAPDRAPEADASRTTEQSTDETQRASAAPEADLQCTSERATDETSRASAAPEADLQRTTDRETDAAPRRAEPSVVPAPPSRAVSGVRRSGAVEDELRILRADDLPQLPPEAFELPR